jgi:hypothetical protein
MNSDPTDMDSRPQPPLGAHSASMTRYASPEDLLAQLAPPGPLNDPREEPTGEVSGRALRDWRLAVTRALGPGAAERVRAESRLTLAELPDAPDPASWLPVGHQLRVTRATLRLASGGLDALPRLLVAPALGLIGGVKRQLLRLTLPPARLLARTDSINAALYRPGAAVASPVVTTTPARGTAQHEAVVSWHGAPFHLDATWQALQVAALTGYFKALDATLLLALTPPQTPQGFTLALRWT